jgi:hypothetical protein
VGETGRDRIRNEERKRAHYATSGEPWEGPEAWYEENWPEYLDAEFVPLAEVEPELARKLASRLVDRVMLGADLDPRHRDEALAQVGIEAGVLPSGKRCVLLVTLPLGSGRPGYEWDGSAETAETLIDNAAERGIEDVVADREMGYPTGWEVGSEEPTDTP